MCQHPRQMGALSQGFNRPIRPDSGRPVLPQANGPLGCRVWGRGGRAVKLPVFRSVGATFAFVIDNWLTLLVIVWVPFLLITALTIGFGAWVSAASSDLMTRSSVVSYAEAQGFSSLTLWLNNALGIVTGLITLMLTAGILRLVIREERPSMPFYLRWGSDEWNLLGTAVVLIVGGFLTLFVTGMVVGLIASQLLTVPFALFGLSILMFCFFVWLAVRVVLAFPAAIGFDQMGITPAWEASSGRFWSLLGYALVWLVLAVIFQIGVLLIVIPDIAAIFADAISRGTSIEAQYEVNLRLQQAMNPGSPEGIARTILLWALSFVPTVIGAVALGIAWRHVDDQSHVKQADVFGSASDSSASDIMGF
jgi:hypothetical protein